MIEVLKKYYTFAELSESAKNKAIQAELERDYGESYFNYDVSSRDFLDKKTTELEKAGFENCQIEYEGFNCQGNGASFTAKNIDLQKVINLPELCKQKGIKYSVLKAILPYLDCKIERTNWHYSHEFTVTCNIYDSTMPYYERLDKYLYDKNIIALLENTVNDIKNDICRDIYRQLENMYEYCYSPEFIKQFYTDFEGEFYFTDSGEFIGNADAVERQAAYNG